MEHDREREPSTEIYYHVKPHKYILLSIFTLGLYEIYWHYRCWKYVRQRDQSSIWPIARGLFFPFWYYPLLSDIGRHTQPTRFDSRFYKGLLTFSLLALGVCWRLPDPWWLLSFLTFLPTLPALSAIDGMNAAIDGPPVRHAVHRPVNYLAYLFGGPIIAYSLLAAIHFFPSTKVMPGGVLWERDVAFLRQTGILAPEEEIIYFYSLSVLSARTDGQFISEDYVTSYWVDPATDEIYMAYAAYEDIADIEVQWGSGLQPTVVSVFQNNGDQFELWLSTEGGGDRRFVEEMNRLWSQRRMAAVMI